MEIVQLVQGSSGKPESSEPMWKIQIAGAHLSLRVGKLGAGGSPGLTGQPDKGSERPSLKKK